MAGPGDRAERVFPARADRVLVLHAVGAIERSRNRHREAPAALDEARVLCERLLMERPGDALLQVTLADSQKSLESLHKPIVSAPRSTRS